MSIDFSVIKDAVPIDKVCKHYIDYATCSEEKATARCPFHNDRTPSFVVNFVGEYAGTFHCFGCHAHGDIIDFVERMEHSSKPEAALKICDLFAPGLLTDDNGKFERKLKNAKKKAEKEKKELTFQVRELCELLRKDGKEEKADNYISHIEGEKFSVDDMYTLLRLEGAKGTADKIETKYHCEEHGDAAGRGRPTKEPLCLESFKEWLENNGIVVRRNAITRAVSVTGLEDVKLSDDLRATHIPIVIHDKVKFDYSCSLDTVCNLLSVIAGANEFNPVLDLLTNSPDWDGVDRLATVYEALHISKDDKLSRTYIKKWFIQCISLQYNTKKAPFGAEGVLVLQGAQGIGKTSCIRKLALHDTTDGYLTKEFREGIGAFKEGVIVRTDNKDSVAQATSAWVVELGELSGTMRKSLADDLKAFVTQATDEYRAPYTRESATYSRRTSYFGTVNDSEFLVDPTGSRRWWVIPIPERIDLAALDTLDKIQFWKQIKKYSDQNRQSFRLSQDEMENLNERNAEFEKLPPAVDEILDIVAQADEQPTKHEWIPNTTTAFVEYYPSLSKYSLKIVRQAINYISAKDERIIFLNSVTSEQAKKYGLKSTRGRFVVLPYQKTAIIYSCPSKIPPEKRVPLANGTPRTEQKILE